MTRPSSDSSSFFGPFALAPIACLIVAFGAPAASAQDEVTSAADAAIAAEAHAVTSRLLEGWRWRFFDDSAVGPAAITALWVDADESLLAATAEGLHRYDLHRWEALDVGGVSDGGAIERIVASQGVVYGATKSALWRLDGGARFVRVFPSDDIDAAGKVFVAPGERDACFIVHQPADGGRSEHWEIRGRRIERLDPDVRLPSGDVIDYEVDGAGVHWLATTVGLLHFRSAEQKRWDELQTWELLRDELTEAVCRRLMVFEKPARPAGDDGQGATAARRVLWGLFHQQEDEQDWYLARQEGGMWHVLGRQIRSGARVWVESIVQDRAHNHYATCEDGSLYVLPNGGAQWLPLK